MATRLSEERWKAEAGATAAAKVAHPGHAPARLRAGRYRRFRRVAERHLHAVDGDDPGLRAETVAAAASTRVDDIALPGLDAEVAVECHRSRRQGRAAQAVDRVVAVKMPGTVENQLGAAAVGDGAIAVGAVIRHSAGVKGAVVRVGEHKAEQPGARQTRFLRAVERVVQTVGAEHEIGLGAEPAGSRRQAAAEQHRRVGGHADAAVEVIADEDRAHCIGSGSRFLVEDLVGAARRGELLPGLVAEGAVVGHHAVVVVAPVIVPVDEVEQIRRPREHGPDRDQRAAVAVRRRREGRGDKRCRHAQLAERRRPVEQRQRAIGVGRSVRGDIRQIDAVA
jgi:hypothetical protein